jgi:hypothetical protein
MIEFALAPFCALADMMRGGLWSKRFRSIFGIAPKLPMMALVGGAYWYSIDPTTWWGLLVVVWLPLFAQIMGTGNPMGKLVLGHEAWEKWQMVDEGITREEAELHGWEKYQVTDNAWWSIAWLGCIWSFGATIVALITQNPDWALMTISYTVSMPLAALICRKWFDKSDRWQAIEGIRSGLAYTFTRIGIMI